jgi:hypothetical protein
MQLVAEAHETPSNALVSEPAGAGVDWIDHSVPFQRSASGNVRSTASL